MPGGQMPYHQPDSVKPKKEKPKKTRDTSLYCCCCLPFITLLGIGKNTEITKKKYKIYIRVLHFVCTLCLSLYPVSVRISGFIYRISSWPYIRLN